MREEYDFSNSVKNPYAKHVKKEISIRIETDTIDYCKDLAKETGITYQNLINSYLSGLNKSTTANLSPKRATNHLLHIKVYPRKPQASFLTYTLIELSFAIRLEHQ